MMIDYAFKFTNAAAAQADASMLAGYYNVSVGWLLDRCITGLQVWRPSQDVTAADPSPPPATLTTHTYLTGFFVVVSLDTPAPIPALINHSALQFALNRTARLAGQAFVLQNNIGAVINDIAAQPLFEMSNPYPIGGFS
jgi:hypothetical protein